MQRLWRLLIGGLFIVILTACGSKEAVINEQPSKEYLEWKQQVESLLKDKPYILPAYDPKIGPIEMVYNELTPTAVSFDLYHSDTYKVSNELIGVRALHDLFYSFSWDKKGKELNDSGVLYRIREQDVFNDKTTEYRKEDLNSLKAPEQSKDLQEVIVAFLSKKGVSSAQVEIVHLERETKLDFQFMINNQNLKSYFSIDKQFSDRTVRELEHYLGDLSKLIGK
ncbi:hypothetical protein NDK47_11150 [Brevibacillus ruminantium]|uniref:Lipoprotein n=1 Tax=Brevibacillus ruminantium TaxID=2950604 RepID=A0ABY4WKW5_9BACL|nr:hypothetical protein [Brevibacillus ruminantium]USG67791.1 hypothetical protein NDK47_11150 [Brevibacillus ruminantium]